MSCWLTASQPNKTGVITASESILKATDDVQATRGGNKRSVWSRTESPFTCGGWRVFSALKPGLRGFPAETRCLPLGCLVILSLWRVCGFRKMKPCWARWSRDAFSEQTVWNSCSHLQLCKNVGPLLSTATWSTGEKKNHSEAFKVPKQGSASRPFEMSQQGYFPNLYFSYNAELANQVKGELVLGVPTKVGDTCHCGTCLTCNETYCKN